VRQPGEGKQVPPRAGATAATILFDDGHEEVRFEDWRPEGSVTVESTNGLEFLLLSGGLTIGGETLEPQAWGRLPAGMALHAQASQDGARVWMRRGPLLHENVCAF